MDSTSLLFLLLLAIAGGVIAYVGDWLGRKIGKKRITLFGLRPKNTAALFTVLAGVLSVVLAVGVVSLLSEPVRAWLIQGSKVQEDLKRTRGMLESARAALEGEREAREQVRGKLTEEQAKLAKAGAETERLRADAAKIRAEAESLKREIQRARNELRQTGQRLASLRKEFDALKAEAAQLQASTGELGKQNKELSEQNLNLASENRALDKRIEDTQQAIADYQTLVKTLEARSAELSDKLIEQQKLADAQRQLVQVDLEAAQTALDDARRQLKDARDQVSLYRSFQEDFNISLANARFSRLLVNVRDELARLPLPESVNKAEMNRLILALLEASHKEALARNAEPKAQGQAAALVPYVEQTGDAITPAQQMEVLAERAANQDREQLLIARAGANVFAGEFVPLTIELRANPVVYRAGQVVGELRVRRSDSERDIVEQIGEYVRTVLAVDAVSDGMIPALGSDRPLGEIDSQALLELIPRIKASGESVRLQFLAARDTRAGDALVLGYRLAS